MSMITDWHRLRGCIAAVAVYLDALAELARARQSYADAFAAREATEPATPGDAWRADSRVYSSQNYVHRLLDDVAAYGQHADRSLT